MRLIDDFTDSGINSCVLVSESPLLHTVDVASAMLTLWFKKCSDAGHSPQLATRTFDLKSAYRQLGLSAEGRAQAVLKVFDPTDQRVKLFRANVLPFGAVRSVHSFLRVARAIWWIGVFGASLMWTSFFDDFISFTPPGLQQNTEQTILALFRLVGWVLASDEHKTLPYGDKCDALGVSFDLTLSSTGLASVRNTAGRIEELCSEIDSLLQSGTCTAKLAQRLRGKMQFAESCLFGRAGKRCIATLAEFAEGKRSKLSAKDNFFLNCFKDLLQRGPPRELSALGNEHVLIFTDACFERDSRTWVCGIGGCFIDISSGCREWFSVELSPDQRRLLGENSKKQIIFEAEAIASLVALMLWLDKLLHKRCTLFVDNEGVKFCLIRGLSDNPAVDFFAEQFAKLESVNHLYLWFSRVASKCNISDEPSRGVEPSNFSGQNKSHDAERLLREVLSAFEMG